MLSRIKIDHISKLKDALKDVSYAKIFHNGNQIGEYNDVITFRESIPSENLEIEIETADITNLNIINATKMLIGAGKGYIRRSVHSPKCKIIQIFEPYSETNSLIRSGRGGKSEPYTPTPEDVIADDWEYTK